MFNMAQKFYIVLIWMGRRVRRSDCVIEPRNISSNLKKIRKNLDILTNPPSFNIFAYIFILSG
jgi:hypothetical protein